MVAGGYRPFSLVVNRSGLQNLGSCRQYVAVWRIGRPAPREELAASLRAGPSFLQSPVCLVCASHLPYALALLTYLFPGEDLGSSCRQEHRVSTILHVVGYR